MNKGLEHISNLIKEYQIIILTKRKRVSVIDSLKKEQARLDVLKLKVEKEYQDIKELEDSPLAYIFSTILKSNREQLEKEKQEYLLAVLEYRDAEKTIKILEYELSLLETKIKDESIITKTLNNELEKLEDSELYSKSRYLLELKTIHQEFKNLLKLKIEAQEAHMVTCELRDNFLNMIGFLNKASEAEIWSGLYNDIQKSKLKKKQNIDKAHGLIPVIKKLLIFLKGELEDMKEYQDFFKRAEAYIKRFNIEYYKDLIEDWINDSKLIETLSTTMRASAVINKLLNSLESAIIASDESMKELTEKRSHVMEKLKSGV